MGVINMDTGEITPKKGGPERIVQLTLLKKINTTLNKEKT
jgi:hypothetical protein